MRKTLFLHIGHFKTGTTAIQVFCEWNRAVLALKGLNYADFSRWNSKHSFLAFSIYRAVGVKTLLHRFALDTPPEELWEALFKEVRESRQPATLISSEEFIRMGAFPEAVARLRRILARAPDIDVRVIVYLREPADHLRSWFNQLVKMGQKVPGYNRAVHDEMEVVHIDYASALAPWIDLVGKDRVQIRSYISPGDDGRALLEDFVRALGLRMPKFGVRFPSKDPNPRLDARSEQLKRIMHNARIQDDIVRNTLKRAQDYFARELADRPEPDMRGTADRIRAGLDRLEAERLPDCHIDFEKFRGRLLEPEDPETTERTLMLGFLLEELHFVREMQAKRITEVEKRLKALQEAFDAAYGAKTSGD
jgi:hypothetical protein